MDEQLSPAVLGDEGPWVTHLALAWRTLADPEGRFPVPRVVPSPDPWKATEQQIERWGPLLHVLVHGLGWTRVDLGLARWVGMGRPVEEPVLRLVHDWYGDEVLDVLAWEVQTGSLRGFADALLERAPYRRPVLDALPTEGPWRGRRLPSHWASGSDPMHLLLHALTPLELPGGGLSRIDHGVLDDDPARPCAVTVVGGYAGWAVSHAHYGKRVHDGGRSWRTDVVVLPLGWLGTYRWSRTTGGWFRGRHRWHLLGA